MSCNNISLPKLFELTVNSHGYQAFGLFDFFVELWMCATDILLTNKYLLWTFHLISLTNVFCCRVQAILCSNILGQHVCGYFWINCFNKDEFLDWCF